MTISIDVDMSSVLKEPVSSFLTRQKFTVCNDSIQPPKAKTCIVECIFCVLYCLSWKLCFRTWSWISSCELCYKTDVCALTQTITFHLNSSFELCCEIDVCAPTQTIKFHLNFKFHCSLCLNFFHPLAWKKYSIYSYKFFHNYHLSESSFTCSGLWASGLAPRPSLAFWMIWMWIHKMY